MRNYLAGPNRDVPANWGPPKAVDTADEALITKIAAGNRLAMQALFARHHTRIYRFVLRMLGDNALAEDLTSDVFLSVWQQATGSRHARRSRPGCWLLPVTRRWPNYAAVRKKRHPTRRARRSAIRRIRRKSPSRSSIVGKSCASAWGGSPGSIGR